MKIRMTAPVIALRKPSIALTVLLGQVVRPYLSETASNADQACEVAQMLDIYGLRRHATQRSRPSSQPLICRARYFE